MDAVSVLPIAFAVALAAAPAAGVPTVISPGCDVSDATLSWGVTESFRAGDWTTADGASYAAPAFEWSGGTGRYDPATGEGSIRFTGSVRLTDHDGPLDTTFANPVIYLGSDSGELHLDVSGVAADGNDVKVTELRLVDLPSVEVVGGDAVRTVDAETVLTDVGTMAFPHSEAGEKLDPIELSMTVGKVCAPAHGGGDVVDERPGGAAWPLMVGLVAFGMLAAIAAGVGVFVATRRRGLGP